MFIKTRTITLFIVLSITLIYLIGYTANINRGKSKLININKILFIPHVLAVAAVTPELSPVPSVKMQMPLAKNDTTPAFVTPSPEISPPHTTIKQQLPPLVITQQPKPSVTYALPAEVPSHQSLPQIIIPPAHLSSRSLRGNYYASHVLPKKITNFLLSLSFMAVSSGSIVLMSLRPQSAANNAYKWIRKERRVVLRGNIWELAY